MAPTDTPARLRSLPPIVGLRPRILVLGSMPGALVGGVLIAIFSAERFVDVAAGEHTAADIIAQEVA